MVSPHGGNGAKAQAIPQDAVASNAPAGLYVHVPFCRGKCPYCDFYSEPSPALASRWVDGVLREADLYGDLFSRFDTLYLGGGTPSFLSGEDLGRLLSGLQRRFRWESSVEITLEANPDDVTPEKAALWWDLGINRLSLGVQSLDDAMLGVLGRRHTAAQAAAAVEAARQAGFTNLGLDLMWGLPGQSLAQWRETMESVLAFSPEHLSCYELTLEKGTVFYQMACRGDLSLPSQAQSRLFFTATSRFLRQRGYVHYEISNFARGDVFRSRHNQKYWRHVPYLGLGPSAHSFDGRRRWWNARSVETYCEMVEAGGWPVAGREIPGPEERRLEALMLGFRTREGVPLALVGDTDRARRAVTTTVSQGLLEVQRQRLRPTLAGWLVANRLPLLFD
ncbi:oxygen-independent coproporphyrinogen-3 oxidase [Desulfacinum hydrothermale DSM 13146]|uniref:Heme chaperone HemW n=1 Tax=Desulfacinum hydrothermale DSM 13146 TaxID=1121390 RepID=A0A1W1XMB3_9BACT|nr:radical SAM family heme chaperone HemW [Desulfacinum hydrothermale]SMC24985.1 oxygen-independent coproporphyrinogen-3 oxidase [Desulfacinum hydrothermale DSM 13146]